MSQIFLGLGRTNPRIPCSTHTRLLQPKQIQLWAYDLSSDVVVDGLDLENLEKKQRLQRIPSSRLERLSNW